MAATGAFAAFRQLSRLTELLGPLLLADDVVVERPVYRDFDLQLPPAPGLVMQLDADRRTSHRRNRASQAIAITA